MRKGVLILLISTMLLSACTKEPVPDTDINTATEELGRLLSENEILKAENELLKAQIEAMESGETEVIVTDEMDNGEDAVDEEPMLFELVSVYDEASDLYGIETMDGDVIYGPIFDSVAVNPDSSFHVTVGSYLGDVGLDGKLNWRGNMTLPESQIIIVDDSASDASFAAFFEDYKNAVSEKDVDFIQAHVAESVSIYIDTYQTSAEFMAAWNLDVQPETSDFWREMGVVLKLGVSNEGTYFMAPNFSPNTGTITGEGVNVRNAPSLDSDIIARASYEPVLDTWMVHDEWARVILHDGTLGYVHQDYFRGEYGYGAFFRQDDGVWKLYGFNVGD